MALGKYSSICAMALPLSQSIHMFALKAFDADSSGWSKSQGVDFSHIGVSLHPSHMWLDSWSRMDMVNP